MKRFLLFVVVVACMVGCGSDDEGPIDYNVLTNLPADSGGVHKAFLHEATESPYGHYLYTPSSYNIEGAEFPLLVFLHGAGEKGNSKENEGKLELVLRNGPPKMIQKETWEPTYPMVVASPQCHDGGWNADKIHEFIEYLVEEYNINKKRIYLTGLSMGGYGTFGYVGSYGIDGFVAACVPICGGGSTGKAENFLDVATWIFHGDADGTVSVNNSIKMFDAINAVEPAAKRAKLTIYPGVGHNSWTKTYDGTGMGTESNEYDAFDQNIYDWMFQFDKETVEQAVE